MRDIKLGNTETFIFPSRQFSTGAPYALVGGVAAVYENDSDTEITAGVTLSASVDSRTGFNRITVVATTANTFEVGKSYSVVMIAGTVDSISVEGAPVGEFTIESSAAILAIKAGIAVVSVTDPVTVTGSVTVGTNLDKTGYTLAEGEAIPGCNACLDSSDRIANIFLDVRDTLNDQQKQRYSDETLLRHLNSGIKDIALQTKLFKSNIVLPILEGVSVYALPSSVLRVSHCSYNWKPLALKSTGWMDHNKERDWKFTSIVRTSDSDKDYIKYAVFDDVKRRELLVYPRPFGEFDTSYVASDVYGVTTALEEYTFDPLYGVVNTLVDSEIVSENNPGLYGILTDLVDSEAFIVYYTECPELPMCVTDDPPLDSCFDNALTFWITSRALRNDLDTQNRSMANEELEFYLRDLREIGGLASTDSVSAPSFESTYNGIG